ncbi:MAG: LPS export ABC transporter permease LptF [Candidatus Accumulibacter sp.]|nr:LPS export ABC transporter permease LptF [Accumulibacter sp.]
MIFQHAARREFTQSAAGVFVALFAILLTTQLIRFLNEAAQGAITPEAVIALLGFSALNYIPALLSLSSFVAILLTLSRSYRDSEMIIWFSSGLPLTAWLRPVLVFTLPLIGAIGGLSLFVSPWALSESAEYRENLGARKDTGQTSPGIFQESSNGENIVFVEGVAKDESSVKNVFVTSAMDGMAKITVAASGHREIAENGDRFIVLENGYRYEVTPGLPEFRVMEFESYAIRTETKEMRGIQRTIRNMPTLWLLQSDQPRAWAEVTWRVGLPVSAFVLALLAIPLAFVNPRAGRSANMLLAVFTYFLYNNLLTISQAWIANGKISFATGLFVPHFLMLCFLPLLFYRRIALFSFSRFFR